jgi:hypothetical protein
LKGKIFGIKYISQETLTGFPEGRAKNGAWLSLILLKSSLAGFPVPESRRYHPDAPMDFAGLAELSVLAFASSKVVQC